MPQKYSSHFYSFGKIHLVIYHIHITYLAAISPRRDRRVDYPTLRESCSGKHFRFSRTNLFAAPLWFIFLLGNGNILHYRKTHLVTLDILWYNKINNSVLYNICVYIYICISRREIIMTREIYNFQKLFSFYFSDCWFDFYIANF